MFTRSTRIQGKTFVPVGVSWLLSFHVAEVVLDYFREQFIKEMDANTVVMEFEYKGIIPVGIRDTILKTDCPKLQNECLHACLMKTCTDDALKTACDVITGVRGNTRMQTLGKEMKRKLESGVCAASLHACLL